MCCYVLLCVAMCCYVLLMICYAKIGKCFRIIREHAADYKNNPLFLMMSYANPHTPIQVPEKFIESNSHIKNKIRYIYIHTRITHLTSIVRQLRRTLFTILAVKKAAHLINIKTKMASEYSQRVSSQPVRTRASKLFYVKVACLSYDKYQSIL